MLPQAEQSLAFAIYSKNGDTRAVYFVFLLDGEVLGPGGRGLISFFSVSWTYFAHFRSNFSNPSLTRHVMSIRSRFSILLGLLFILIMEPGSALPALSWWARYGWLVPLASVLY